MVDVHALAEPYQVSFRAGTNGGIADTLKNGVGGSAGLRPHELLEASLATCLAITARMALADLGLPDDVASISVSLDRQDESTRFRYAVTLAPEIDSATRDKIHDRLERSPVRCTLSKKLAFELVDSGLDADA